MKSQEVSKSGNLAGVLPEVGSLKEATGSTPQDAMNLRENSARWTFFRDNAQSMINGMRFAEWLSYSGVMEHGSMEAAIDSVRLRASSCEAAS